MKTRTLLTVSGALWVGGFLYAGEPGFAAVLGAAHAIIWQLHRIEVKLNRFLGDRGLSVSDQELAE